MPRKFSAIVRNEPPTCENSATKQIVSQFSNVDDIVASAEGLALCSVGCNGGVRSVRFRIAGVLCLNYRSRRRYHQSDSGELLGPPFVLR